MTTKLPFWIFTFALASAVYSADEKGPADDWKPASSNQSGKEYPKVNSEGRVKFRIVAPDAKTVGCTCRERREFTKGEEGAWYG